MRHDILGLGCVAVDELLFVREYPRADAKAEVLRRERHCGGLCATALVAASRLGAQCAYAGVVGPRADPDSNFVLTTLRREGVNVRHTLRQSSARPVRSQIVVEEHAGSRTIFYDTQGAAGAGATHPPRALIASSRVLMVDRFGLPGMTRAAKMARAEGRPVVGDFESADAPALAKLLPWVNHLIVPRETASRWTRQRNPGAAAERLRAMGHEVAVVTCGADGCWVAALDLGKARHVPAFKVKAKDTTGCGDVFHGAYAAGLAWGMDLMDRVRLASAAAALKATRTGGQAGCPTREDVERMIDR